MSRTGRSKMMNSIFSPHSFFLNLWALPNLIVGMLVILEGVFVISQGKRAVAPLAYFLITLTSGIFLTGVGIVCSVRQEILALNFSRYITWFGIIFVTPSVYFFSVTWGAGLLKAQIKNIRRNYFMAAVFYLICIFSPYLVQGMYHYRTGYFPKAGFLELPFIVWFYTVMGFALINFLRIHKAATTPSVKKNTKLIFFAFAIAFIGSAEFLPNYGLNVFPVAFLSMSVFSTLIGYCVIRYRLMDIETVIHKTLMWLLSTAVAIVPFATLIYGVQRFYRPLSAWSSMFDYLVVAMAFYFYFRSIQPRLDHFFQRQGRNLRSIYERFSRELVYLKSLRDLLQSFARMLRRQLYVRRLAVFLLDEKNGEYVPAIAKGLRNLKPIPASHLFLGWLEKKDSVVMGDLVGSDPEVEAFRADVDDFFHATQGMVAVPFVLGGKLIGLASLGRKANLKSYRAAEVQFLIQLKIPVTIAFSNSMRYENINELYTQVRKMSEELKRWNVELEHRVEDRTRELVKTQEQLTQAEKLATLGTLAGGVAHEINNPLTAVLTNAQILLMDARKDDVESISLIEEGAKRCQTIVQKLMNYARKTAEEAPHRDVDLREVVQGTCALLGFQLKQENISVEMKLGIVPPVKGIAGELNQVLTNLLVNARDAIYTAKVAGRITVETLETSGSVELVVTDNGIGISKENQKKIFDPFFTTKDVGSGTGLGLAVSFGILKRHDASITVESHPGEGATFVIRFPKK